MIRFMPWYRAMIDGLSDLAMKLVKDHGMPIDLAEQMVRNSLSGDFLNRAIYFDRQV